MRYDYACASQEELIRVRKLLEAQGYMLVRIGEWAREGAPRVVLSINSTRNGESPDRLVRKVVS